MAKAGQPAAAVSRDRLPLPLMVPLATALGIAVLYGAGAIVKAGQLRGEGFAIRDNVPLVPLEQLLALGIGIVVSSLLWLLGIAVLFSVYLRFTWLWGAAQAGARTARGREVAEAASGDPGGCSAGIRHDVAAGGP